MRLFTLLFFFQFLCLTNCSQKKAVKEIEIPEEEFMLQDIDYAAIGLKNLSEYGFFKGKLADLSPAEDVVPYDLNSPLFTDYALKARFIRIPKGQKILYHQTEVLGFPVGTVLIKNFYYSADQLEMDKRRIIETRLLIRETEGWKALPYVWNEEQSDATLEITGAEESVVLKNQGGFTYAVPTMNQCKSCHEKNGQIVPIGPSARQLNKRFRYQDGTVNQLSKWKSLGWFDELPDLRTIPELANWADSNSSNLNKRARAYLEINCGHCHRPEGPGKNSGLDLTTFSLNDLTLGIYKGPVAAGKGSGGLQYDIHPGSPDQSILLYRMASVEAAVKMPELGRNLVHTEGVELIRKWIEQLKD